jgi:hypothetical protein
VGPTLGESFAAKLADLVIAKANPSCRSVVCRIAMLLQVLQARRLAGSAFFQKRERLLRSNRIRNVREVDGANDLLGLKGV